MRDREKGTGRINEWRELSREDETFGTQLWNNLKIITER
jgi:hypothetical protein